MFCLEAEVIDPNVPRVVAVSAVDLEYLDGSSVEGTLYKGVFGLGALAMAVYGHGPGISFSVTRDETGEWNVSDEGLLQSESSRQKSNEEVIATDCFALGSDNGDELGLISALLYTPLTYFRVVSNWTSGFAILHNANAAIGFPKGVLADCKEWESRGDSVSVVGD